MSFTGDWKAVLTGTGDAFKPSKSAVDFVITNDFIALFSFFAFTSGLWVNRTLDSRFCGRLTGLVLHAANLVTFV